MFHWIATAFSQVKVVKDIWTEEDDGGKVRFATVQVFLKGREVNFCLEDLLVFSRHNFSLCYFTNPV